MKKRLIASVTCLCLLLIMLLSSTLAWFTDQTEVTKNTMTVGNISIKQLEQYRDETGTLKLWHPKNGVSYVPDLWPAVPNYATGKLESVQFGINGQQYSLYNQDQKVINKIVSVDNESSYPAFVRTVFAFEMLKTETGWENPLETGDVILNVNGQIEWPGAMIKIDDVVYVVGVYTYQNALDAETRSAPSLLQFYLNQTVGNEFITAVGTEYDILVLSQAVQTAGFENYGANGALNTSFGEVNAANAARWFDGEYPWAFVNDLGARQQSTTINDWGTSAEVTLLDLPFVLQFLPNESYEEAQASEYRYWHADYVIKADRPVGAESIALAGYYKAFCGPEGDGSWNINNGNWVALTSSDDIDADTEIRLLEAMGFPVNYEEICQFGNDGIGFLCSAADLTGANAGTTITVELRLFETEAPSEENGNSHNVETGESIVVGTYTYTFPAYEVEGQEALNAALNAGIGDISLAAGNYTMPSTTISGEINISGTTETVLDVTKGAYLDNATVTIEGVTIKSSTGYVMDANGNQGSDYAALYTPNVTYVDCVFEGPMRVGRDGAKFINCTFKNLGNDYIWTYGNDVTFEGCTFNTDGKAILIYSDGGNEVSQVVVKNCVFNATQGAKAGAIANQNCAAIEIQNYGNGVKLTTSDNTYDSNFSGEWRIKAYESGKPAIFVNGIEYTQIAIDGKLMTIDESKNVTVQN